jgi:hypothetical protein
MTAAGIANDFGRCREQLERAVAASCAGQRDWPAAVAAAVHAAVRFAATDPDAALTLTERAATRWKQREPSYTAAVEHFARLLSHGAPPRNPRLPNAAAVVARIFRQVNLELEAGRAGELMEIAPDLTFLALMPYLGFAEAREWSKPIPAASPSVLQSPR